MDNNRLLFTSGLLSFTLFATFSYLFFFFVFHKEAISNFALHKKEYISISVVSTPKSGQKHKKNKKQSISATSVAQTKKTTHQNIDVNDLFSDVWTKKIRDTKKTSVDNRNLNAIGKRLSRLSTDKSEDLSQKATIEKESTDNEANNSISTADEVNEYLAKIHALVYESFNVPPNSEGYSVKALIVLNALGKLIDFRILTYSGNDALNSEADNIKKRLENIVFPLSPDNKTTNTIVILTSQKE